MHLWQDSVSQLNPTRILCSCSRCSSLRGLTYRARRANLTCCCTLKVLLSIFKGARRHAAMAVWTSLSAGSFYYYYR